MKTQVLTIAFLFLAIGLSAQDQKAGDKYYKSNREIRKEQKEAELAAEYAATSEMIDSMQFVLEADYLSNQSGYRISVNSGLNFIMVRSKKAVIQTGNNTGMGYNGVGGVTAEGSISNLRVTRDDKHKRYNISMDVNTSLGLYSVFINVSASGRASASMSGIWPGSLTFDGFIKPLQASRTFKGSNTY